MDTSTRYSAEPAKGACVNGRNFGALDAVLAVLLLLFVAALLVVVGVGLGAALWMVLT